MKSILIEFKNRFIKGLFILLPIGVTLWIVYKVFMITDSIIGNTIYKLIGFRIPGLGLIITIAVIVIIGSSASHYIGRKLTSYIQQLFEKIPIIKAIYLPLKDFIHNFSDKKSSNFKKVALVTYPMEGSYSLGFITKENININGDIKTIIFIPTTPNPTSGFLVFVDDSNYKELNIPVDQALKTIISLGSIAPDIIMEVNHETDSI